MESPDSIMTFIFSLKWLLFLSPAHRKLVPDPGSTTGTECGFGCNLIVDDFSLKERNNNSKLNFGLLWIIWWKFIFGFKCSLLDRWVELRNK